MAVAMQQISPVAHLPVVLGVVRKLNVAATIATFCPPHPANVLSCGRGVEALLLAILDCHHALYKVGTRLEERGMSLLLQPRLTYTALHDDRLGQSLDALFAANLHRVFGAVALKALEVYALPTLWLHQDTTITLYGGPMRKGSRPAHSAPSVRSALSPPAGALDGTERRRQRPPDAYQHTAHDSAQERPASRRSPAG